MPMTNPHPWLPEHQFNRYVSMTIKRRKAFSKRIATERAEALKPLREFVAEAIEQHQKAINE